MKISDSLMKEFEREAQTTRRHLERLPEDKLDRDFILSHLIHHRAQFSVYLRLLNVPVPGSYGPSADEQA